MNGTDLNRCDFSIGASVAYDEIKQVATKWILEDERILNAYEVEALDEEMTDYDRVRKEILDEEQSRFLENLGVISKIKSIIETAQKTRRIYKETFYVCRDRKQQIEGVMAIANRYRLIRQETFLELSYLVTNPKNMISTLNFEDSRTPIRGIGSLCLMKAEEIAREKGLAGVFLTPMFGATDFYRHRGYETIRGEGSLLKRVDQTAQEIMKAA